MIKKPIDLIDEIMKKHGVYCTFTIKPTYDKESSKYLHPLYEVYISKMPSGENFKRNLSYRQAIKVLRDYLKGKPEDAFKKMKQERIASLRERQVEILEEIKNLEVE